MATVPLNIDSLFGAALAPIVGVLTFWFIQLIFIEIQKRILLTLSYQHKALCRFTNFIGIFFQTICQALGYTVTRSGIAAFQINVNYGKVQPKKEKTGVLDWIARSFLLFGPFFIPAGLVLLASSFVIDKEFVFPVIIHYTFLESLNGFVVSLSTYVNAFVNFLVNIDLFNPIYITFILLLLFFGLGIRPSYIGEARKENINVFHDLILIKDHLIEKPIYLLVITCIIYTCYLLSLYLYPIAYIGLLLIFGWMALTAIIAILLTYPVLLLIKATDKIRPHWKLVPIINLVISYVLTRMFLIYYNINRDKTIALLVMILSTILITILLIKYKKTNRFKTAPKMKHMRIADVKKRTIKKRAD